MMTPYILYMMMFTFCWQFRAKRIADVMGCAMKKEAASAWPGGVATNVTCWPATLAAKSTDNARTEPASALSDGMADTAPFVSQP
jgi:hypothetical protein